jgi:hypothetical protein
MSVSALKKAARILVNGFGGKRYERDCEAIENGLATEITDSIDD